MKIGLVLPYNIAKGGGVKEVVLALYDGLAQKGHDVVIITPQPREPYEHDTRKVIFLGTAADFKMPSTTGQISASVMTDEIDAMLEAEAFDVIHFHEPWVPVLSRQILSRSQTVNVATFHAKLPETPMSRTMAKVITPYTKPLLKHIDQFTAVSDAAAEYVRSLAPVDVEIIPNGINLSHFKPRKVTRKEAGLTTAPTILYIGRLERRKGVRHLLDAFRLLHDLQPEARLVIAGDGVDREKLELYVEDLGLEKSVTFLGYIDDAKKLELLQTADLFCSPALYGESFGIVLLEAMASGLVTVAGDNPGYKSVMQGLGNISLENPKSTAEFANRLHLLLNDEELRKLWKKWAKETVVQYDYARVVDLYERAYKVAVKREKQYLKALATEAE
ncbi:glycosyltransferase family 1 protein [Candidatus Saccharibacteria bacterium]|nr:MAG: glycosyltransferase family 1 protein [Candidatus Saccharibacteria bacterium]